MKRFIVFDGADGCGKTTQLQLLAKLLGAQGFDVYQNKALGGTGTDFVQNELRKLLLSPEFPADDTVTEEALFSLSDLRGTRFAQEYLETSPNGIVLADRGIVSHFAYFVAKGYGERVVHETHEKLFALYGDIANQYGLINLIFVPEDESMAMERVLSRGAAVTPRLENVDMQRNVIKALGQFHGSALNSDAFVNITIRVKRSDSILAVHQMVMTALSPYLGVEVSTEGNGTGG